jgi:hypothetical protein
MPDQKEPVDTGDEPWVFVMEGGLDESNEWNADGSWMMLEGLDPPEEIEAMKQAAIEAARARRAARRP